jgi:Fur family transcriptional regulator, peroxide stress response regulator
MQVLHHERRLPRRISEYRPSHECDSVVRGPADEQMKRTDERDLLRQLGLRSTPQRLAIVREVFSRNHPTVGEIYDSVRIGFPTIGLQTVYNTLHTMAQRGLVRELSFSSATRFDGNMRPHANLVCRNCGRIDDAEFASDHVDMMLGSVVRATGFAPDGQRIDVYGLCRGCAAGFAER